MNTAIAISEESPKIFSTNGRLVTTSQAVADYFDKQHKHVLAKIDTLDCSPEFTSANFSAHAENQLIGVAEREIRYFEITKNGFMFLVMGFTGKKAAHLKEAYIAKFDAMEIELHKPVQQMAPSIYPMSGRVLFEYQNGVMTNAQALHPNEFVMTLADHTEMLKRVGYMVIHCDDLKSMTVDEIVKLGDAANRARIEYRAM